MRITSLTNPRVKELVRLQREASARRESGLFCVESLRELERARDAGFKIQELYLCPPVVEENGLECPIPRADGVEISRAVLEKVAYRQNPEGFIAVLRAKTATLEDVPADGRELMVICAGVEKPGNIGAILRSADAAGVAAVLIDNPAFDLFNPNCVRASTGAVFSVPVVCAEPRVLRDELKRRGVQIVAATPEATTPYARADLTRPTAFTLGAEAQGLDDFWRKAADTAVAIPQTGTVDSLNVSVTAALLMFEAVRQRGA